MNFFVVKLKAHGNAPRVIRDDVHHSDARDKLDDAATPLLTRTQIFRCPSILAFASLLQLASGFQFDIPPNTHECFDEQTKASDHVAGTWQVVAPKTPEALAGWKVTVTSPDGESVYSADNERQGAFDYYRERRGRVRRLL